MSLDGVSNDQRTGECWQGASQRFGESSRRAAPSFSAHVRFGEGHPSSSLLVSLIPSSPHPFPSGFSDSVRSPSDFLGYDWGRFEKGDGEQGSPLCFPGRLV